MAAEYELVFDTLEKPQFNPEALLPECIGALKADHAGTFRVRRERLDVGDIHIRRVAAAGAAADAAAHAAAGGGGSSSSSSSSSNSAVIDLTGDDDDETARREAATLWVLERKVHADAAASIRLEYRDGKQRSRGDSQLARMLAMRERNPGLRIGYVIEGPLARLYEPAEPSAPVTPYGPPVPYSSLHAHLLNLTVYDAVDVFYTTTFRDTLVLALRLAGAAVEAAAPGSGELVRRKRFERMQLAALGARPQASRVTPALWAREALALTGIGPRAAAAVAAEYGSSLDELRRRLALQSPAQRVRTLSQLPGVAKKRAAAVIEFVFFKSNENVATAAAAAQPNGAAAADAGAAPQKKKKRRIDEKREV